MIAGLGTSLGGCLTGVCTGWSATYVSKQDVLTPETARKIRTDNEYGVRLGCPGFTPKSQSSAAALPFSLGKLNPFSAAK